MDLLGKSRRLAKTLRLQMGAEAVWLFGSVARGEPGPDSDVDILAVVPQSHESRYREGVLLESTP
jgi:predicted nucleotidyltransferase